MLRPSASSRCSLLLTHSVGFIWPALAADVIGNMNAGSDWPDSEMQSIASLESPLLFNYVNRDNSVSGVRLQSEAVRRPERYRS